MTHAIFHASHAAVRSVSELARARRMRQFCNRMRPSAKLRVLDLGGTPSVWRFVPDRLSITIVNLPGETGAGMPSHHELRFVEGDACDLSGFDDRSFDLVFSNSVIEHVGDEQRQAAFAQQVRRLGNRYWVQTPAKWFPIEAHTGMPLWWFYPESMRQFFLSRWRTKLPDWSESMAQTRVLTLERMQELFPGARFYVEAVAGIPKSYTAYAPPAQASACADRARTEARARSCGRFAHARRRVVSVRRRPWNLPGIARRRGRVQHALRADGGRRRARTLQELSARREIDRVSR